MAPYGRVVVRLSRDFLWMTPLADLGFFFLMALLLVALGRVWPTARSGPAVMGAFTALSAFALG
ncbi:MAG: hypothetical protein PVJ04_06915, partial [Gemmatimonadota bacterium]